MKIHEFHRVLTQIRKASRWPNSGDFSARIDLSHGGYKKCETGERIPSVKALRQICKLGDVPADKTEELLALRNKAKAEQLGIELIEGFGIDIAALSSRVINEMVYTLKQANITVPPKTKDVMHRRVNMIVKAALEKP